MSKNPKSPSSKEEKIYIREDEEIEDVDEESIEEIDDEEEGIRILDDSISKKKTKRKKAEESSYESNDESSKHKKNPFEIYSAENNENQNKRKRRRKKEFTGQGYRCPDCGKSYFSMPALNTHRKSKHDYLKKGGGRGRGRPRKDPLIITPIYDIRPQIHEIKNEEHVLNYSKIENTSLHFFDDENRKPLYGEVINKNTIENILSKYEQFFDGVIINIDNKKFYKKLINEWVGNNKSNNNENKENGNDMTLINLSNYTECINITEGFQEIKKENNFSKSFDEAAIKYLKECSNLTNINFLKTIYFIIILFREGINNYYLEEKENPITTTENNGDKDYTEINGCNGEIPELINIIIGKYFEPNSFFAIKQKDIQDVILHFFHWLYRGNYTDKKVSHG